jgi:PST family polysaccharide transporter
MNSDSNQYFDDTKVKNNLKTRTVRGGTVTVIAQILRQIFFIVSTVILARLLTPQDYGLIAMVTAITGFVILFKDLGLSMATIQREQIDHKSTSTLFWINVALSFALFITTASLSPLISWFYKDPRLIWITITISIGYIFGGFTVQHQALLKRQMRFISLGLIEIFSLLFGIVVGISSALLGAKYWALIMMQLAISLSNAVLTWIFCPWYPSRPGSLNEVKSILAFGGNITGFRVINYFSRSADNILIGRFWGVFELGIYSKAYALLLLPLRQITSPITSVAVPALSRLIESPERYRCTYLRIFEKVAIITMPSIAFMIVTSDWIVLTFLGPEWSQTGEIFAFLGITGMVQPIASTTGWLFITQNRTRHMLQWGAIGGTLAIISFFIGLPWGAAGVALSYSIVGICIRKPLLFWFVGRIGPVRTKDFYIAAIPAICASLSVFLFLNWLRFMVKIYSPLIGLCTGFVCTFFITILMLAMLPAGRRMLSDFKEISKLIFKRNEASSSI